MSRRCYGCMNIIRDDEEFCPYCGFHIKKYLYDIKKECPAAEVAEGLAVRGSDAESSEAKTAAWAKRSIQ